MEKTTTTTTTTSYFLYLTVTVLLITQSVLASTYKFTNYEVGDSAGWYFHPSTKTSSTNFTKWAAHKTFNLGDCISFFTNSNQTMIQTYNETAYKSCKKDVTEKNTFVYDFGGKEIGKSSTLSVSLILSVALTVEGPNYFFSDIDNGLQCTHGMAFKIVVKHGQGLPNFPPRTLDFDYCESSPPSTGTSNGGGVGNGVGVGNGANYMRMRVGFFVVLTGFLVLLLV